MKRKLLCFGFVVSCLVMGTAWGLDDPVGVPWGEWRFSEAFDGAGEALADKASAPGSLIRINAGSTAVTQADNAVIFSETGPGDYLRVDIDDMMENGGGGYVNEYTMIFDVKATQADWLPIYNTGYDNYNAADFWMNAEGALGSGSYSDAGAMPLNTWVRLVVVRTLEAGSWVRDVYVDGSLVLDDLGAEGSDGNSSLYTNAQQDDGQFTILSDSDATVYPGCELANFAYVSIALSAEEIADLGEFNEGGIFDVSSVGASKPLPDEEAVDVLRDATLSWNPGVFAGTHDVYFGEALADVSGATRSNPMGVQLAQGQTATSIDAGRLTFGQTYYWRVDEVNATPDQTIFAGEVWSFTVEPYSIQIPGSTVAVTASSASNEFSIPERTLDGSGLGADDTHTISPEDMWFTESGDTDPWIQYEFDTTEKLDVMRVWNSNSSAEAAIGWGVKDVQIEYSADGQTWNVLADTTQLNRAPGLPIYNQYDEIDFGGAAARYVRLNVQSNWGGVLLSYSLSEVQFYSIPAAARTPEPASGSVDVLPDATVTWRAGRGAAQHTVYVSTDMEAVADGSAPSVTSSTNSLDLGSLDLQLGETYYWRVDEVNEAQAQSMWAGPVWSLSTSAVLVVDDFESYGNNSPDRPFQTWLDGFGYSDDEFFPVGYGGNGTGAGVGHDIWSLSSPNFDGTIMEGSITIEGSSQSMPFYYNNSGAASQTDRTWATPQDWTVGGAATLVLYFYGSEDNTGGPLFAKINGQKVTYPDTADLSVALWHQWNIDLASLGIDLTAVTSMSLGVEGNGSGMILIDDMSLYRNAPAVSDLVTYGFNDLPDGGDAFDGVHGGIDFGTGNWWGGDSWYGTAKCAYFYDDYENVDIPFTLPANATLVSIVISADGAYAYSISDGVNPAITGTTGTTPEVIHTNWTSGGSTITLNTAGGWNVVFDDITYKP